MKHFILWLKFKKDQHKFGIGKCQKCKYRKRCADIVEYNYCAPCTYKSVCKARFNI
jgi:hypothetical protein